MLLEKQEQKNAAKNGNMFYDSRCATKNLTIKYRPRSRVLSISSRLVKQGEKRSNKAGKKGTADGRFRKMGDTTTLSLLFLRSLGASSLSASLATRSGGLVPRLGFVGILFRLPR